MTCRQALQLLEDYVDNELSPQKAEELKRHLDGCQTCREEYNAICRLKEVLKHRSAYLPGKDYWAETSSLILARTTESSAGEDVSLSLAERRTIQRNSFIRSLASVFVSLVILIMALFLGSQQNQRVAHFNSSESPIFAIVPLEALLGADNSIIVTRVELLNQAKGMILIGSPGLLGRFSALFDIRSSADNP